MLRSIFSIFYALNGASVLVVKREEVYNKHLEGNSTKGNGVSKPWGNLEVNQVLSVGREVKLPAERKRIGSTTIHLLE